MSTLYIILYTAIHLTLDSCLAHAEAHNAEVMNAQLGIAAATAQKGEALAAYFPTINLSAFGYQSIRPLVTIGVTDVIGTSEAALKISDMIDWIGGKLGINTKYEGFQHGYAAGAQLMQPIYAGGRIVTANKMAKLGYQAAQAKRQMTLRNNKENVEKAFWQVIGLQEQLATLQQINLLLDTVERDVRSAVRSGLVTENDLLKVQLKRGELESGVLQVENGIRLTKMNLLNTIGMQFTLFSNDPELPHLDSIYLEYKALEVDSAVLGNGLEALSIAGLPESQLLDMQVRLREYEKRMTLGEALPQMGLGGSYGYTRLNTTEQWNGVAYVMLTIPLTDWGKTARKMQRHEAQIEMAKNDRDYLNSQLLLQVRMLWMNLETAYRQVKVAEQNYETAQQSYNHQMAHFRAGMIAVNELLEGETSLRQAAEGRLKALIAYREALTAYKLRISEAK